jgi:hypothetical protein
MSPTEAPLGGRLTVYEIPAETSLEARAPLQGLIGWISGLRDSDRGRRATT